MMIVKLMAFSCQSRVRRGKHNFTMWELALPLSASDNLKVNRVAFGSGKCFRMGCYVYQIERVPQRQPASILIPGGGLCFLMDNLCLPWNIYSDDKTDVCLPIVSLSNLVKLFRGFFLSFKNIRACANYVLAALNDFCQS